MKKSIRRTAAEFMKLVPMFSQRLAQRDYEMILVPPHKKRMLLKMYILGEKMLLMYFCHFIVNVVFLYLINKPEIYTFFFDKQTSKFN